MKSRTVGIAEACKILQRPNTGGSRTLVKQLLAKHDAKPTGRIKWGRGYAENWLRSDVERVRNAIKPKATPAPPVVSVQQPLPLAPTVAVDVDEALTKVNSRIDGVAGYTKRCGDEIAHLRAEVALLSSQNRQLISAINRLLIAAQLRPIPEVASNGATHTAPEKTQ